MSALDDIIDIHESECRLTHAGMICCALEPSRSELASLRASLAAAQYRVAELEASTVLTPRKCSPDCYRKGWAAAIEIAADIVLEYDFIYAFSNRDQHLIGARDEKISMSIRALQPPSDCGACNPLAPSIDAVSVIDAALSRGYTEQSETPLDGYGREVLEAIRADIHRSNRNQLAPDTITVSDFRRAVAHLVRYMPCDASDTNGTRLQLADAVESLTDSAVIDINSL